MSRTVASHTRLLLCARGILVAIALEQNDRRADRADVRSDHWLHLRRLELASLRFHLPGLVHRYGIYCGFCRLAIGSHEQNDLGTLPPARSHNVPPLSTPQRCGRRDHRVASRSSWPRSRHNGRDHHRFGRLLDYRGCDRASFAEFHAEAGRQCAGCVVLRFRFRQSVTTPTVIC